MQFESIKVKLSSLAKTEELAKLFAKLFFDHGRFYLSGGLGSGKTTFVQFYLKNLGYKGKVTSPTFNLVKEYALDGILFYHIDAYRLGDAQNVFDLEDALYFEDVILCLEWPEMIERFLEKRALYVEFGIENDEHFVILRSDSTEYASLIEKAGLI